MVTKSGYIVAGFETLATVVDNFILNTKGRFTDNFTREDIATLLSSTCSGFLHSYGQHFGGKKKWDKYSKSEAALLKKCRNMGFFDDSNFVIDSGGFQIATGKLNRTESEMLFKMYYEFLEEYSDLYERAFILDVPPGSNCEVINDFDDLHRWNFESYQKAANLPDDVRSKIIYVHHFRTPKLWDTFDRILKENDLYSRFEHFGTGGIVASMSGDASIPCIIYVLPLIPLLNETIKHNKTHLDFHILGGATFRDLLFYELIKKHVMEAHGVELNITFDSAGLFKAFARARTLHVYNNGSIFKTDVRSNNLDRRFGRSSTVSQKLRSVLNETAERHNLKHLPFDQFYDEVTMLEEFRTYGFLYCIDIYSMVQERMREITEYLYPLYINQQLEEFSGQVELATRRINSDKTTRKQIAKTNSISSSLDMITNLDEDHCKYIIRKCLSKDEFTNLISSEQLLTV